MNLNKDAIINNLFDAGCSLETADQLMKKLKNDRIADGLRILSAHRRTLLDYLHDVQRKIDCLDYLYCMIEKEKINLDKRK